MTLKIDRMDLADEGGNPVNIAIAIFKQIPDISLPIPIRDIAYAVNIKEIKTHSSLNFEGALITTDGKPDGIILVHQDSREQRKRFTIAHELFHYLSPYHTASRFECTTTSMSLYSSSNDRFSQMEIEANAFAAEMLMPRHLFEKDINHCADIEIENIELLAKKYATSKEATARRYIDFLSEPCCIVFSKNNIVRYSYRHKEFPFLELKHGDRIPITSISHDAAIYGATDWSELDNDIWPVIDEKAVYEQAYVMNDGYKLTLLLLDDEEEKEEDNNLYESWQPRFKR